MLNQEQRLKNKEAAQTYWNTRKLKNKALHEKYSFNGLSDKEKAQRLSKVDWNKPISQLSYTD